MQPGCHAYGWSCRGELNCDFYAERRACWWLCGNTYLKKLYPRRQCHRRTVPGDTPSESCKSSVCRPAYRLLKTEHWFSAQYPIPSQIGNIRRVKLIEHFHIERGLTCTWLHGVQRRGRQVEGKIDSCSEKNRNSWWNLSFNQYSLVVVLSLRIQEIVSSSPLMPAASNRRR
jgi:hypothetical protein